MTHPDQAKLELLKQAAIAADAVVKNHTPESALNASLEQMKIAKAYMMLAVPGFILALFDEIERLQVDAERFRFLRHANSSLEFHDAFHGIKDEHMEWLEEFENHETPTPDQYDNFIDNSIRVAKDNGLWPIKPELVLTEEAQADRDAFSENYGDGNCSCHNNAPCSSCTHPGNPTNQEEDSACWTVQP